MKPTPHNLIRFDWALKRLLRNKANFEVLEGFLSVLLKDNIKIESIGDSESNQNSYDDKFNRVDILAFNQKNEIIIVELQVSYEADYWFRMVYGVSKAITEHIKLGDKYSKVRKVYHVSIVYFDLGQGKDYVYHGKTNFVGLHENDVLALSKTQREHFQVEGVSSLFPEYYILRVNNFDDVAKDSLDEWIYYLKNNSLPSPYRAPGLDAVNRQLVEDSLSPEEYAEYVHRVNQVIFEQSVVESNFNEGVALGREEGFAKGLAQGIAAVAHRMLAMNMNDADIVAITGLSLEEIQTLKEYK